jgi:hypothetical protein
MATGICGGFLGGGFEPWFFRPKAWKPVKIEPEKPD